MLPYTAASLIDTMLKESYDPAEAAHHTPLASFWVGWSDPSADHVEPVGGGHDVAARQRAAVRARRAAARFTALTR